MKLNSIIISAIVLFTGCQSDSYYAAQSSNHQRFNGQQEETANYLADIHNTTLLLETMTHLAIERADSRETYLIAQSIREKIKKIQLKINVEATVHRITLSSALSERNDLYYQQLNKYEEKEFDREYVSMMIAKMNELSQSLINYQEKGHNERIKKLSRDIEEIVQLQIRDFKHADLS